MMDLEFLRNLIDIVEDSDLDTIELEHEGTRIKLAKASGKEAGWSVNAPDLSMKDNPSPLVDEAVSAETVSTVEAETGANSNLIEVKSPMVGTLYAASSPDADSYVKVGSRVNEGQCDTTAMIRLGLVDRPQGAQYGLRDPSRRRQGSKRRRAGGR